MLLDAAHELYTSGHPAGAARLCSKVLKFTPENSKALHLLGLITFNSGLTQKAYALITRSLELDAYNFQAWSDLGVICLVLADRQTALKCFEQALALCPESPKVWNNLGVLYEKENLAKAQDCFQKVLQLDPENNDACINLALCCKKQQRYLDAANWYRLALNYSPGQPTVWYRLAECLEQLSDLRGALDAYHNSCQLKPDDAVMLKMQTLLPVVPSSLEEIDKLRADIWGNLLALEHQTLRMHAPWENGRIFFYLAYHGCNDRLFHKLLATLYRRVTPELTWQAEHVKQDVGSLTRRIKIGFISRFFYNHTIAKLNIGYIEQLDRTRFHVTVLIIPGGKLDDMTQRLQAASDEVIFLAGSFQPIREEIAAQQLDILLYTDIGMEPYSYFLAFARLAPVQCMTWGHPATSGIDTIDYFISHTDCETVQSRESYTENLFCLSADAACTCYARPVFPASCATRETFGLESGKNLYYCPQPPFKLHPDFDVIIMKILEHDPDGVVVLLRGIAGETEQLLRQRLDGLMPEGQNRIRFMDPLPFADYIRMLELADVVLDTPHFSGGNSSVEALAVGAAVVTWPSAFLKGRLTYAWYRQIGIMDCVAYNMEEYVQIAVSLGIDVAKRKAVRQRIRQRSHLLFDNNRAVRELEYFFEMALRERKIF